MIILWANISQGILLSLTPCLFGKTYSTLQIIHCVNQQELMTLCILLVVQ